MIFIFFNYAKSVNVGVNLKIKLKPICFYVYEIEPYFWNILEVEKHKLMQYSRFEYDFKYFIVK